MDRTSCQPDSVFSLSLSQENIWNLEQTYKGTPINNISTTIHIKGRIEIDVLQKCLNLILMSDISLRTRLTLQNGKPVQYYTEYIPEQFSVFDFSLTNKSGTDHWETAVAREPMPLYDSPLYYFALFKTGENSGGILVKTHHIISDGWSQVQLSNKIASIYLDFLTGKASVPDESPPYKIHIESEQKYLSSDTYKKDKAFWEEQLSFIAEPSSIKERKGAAISPVGRRKSFVLSGVLNHSIYDFCSRNRVAPFAVFYMALAIYLKRIGGADRFGIGVPILNRMDYIEKQITGMFVSTLPFLNDLNEEWTFTEFNRVLTEQWYEQLRHQRFPYKDIMEISKRLHPDIRNLFNIVLSFQSSNIKGNKDASVIFSGRWHYSGYQSENLCIHLSSFDGEHNFSVDYDYLTQIFSERELESLHEYLINILSTALMYPDKPIWQIPLMGTDELDKVLYRFNQTTKPVYAESVYEEFSSVTAENYDKVAVIHNGKRITNKTLKDTANKWAWKINSVVPNTNSVVAVILPKGIELIECLFGITQSGNTWVLISPDSPVGRICELITDSGAELIITSDNISSNLININSHIVSIDNINHFGEMGELSEFTAPPANLAYIVYTSGSTGKPKGVEITQRNLLNFSAASENLFTHGAVLSLCNVSFDAFILESVVAILNKQTLILANETEQTIPSELASLIKNYAVGFISMTPSRLESYMKNRDFCQSLRRIENIVCGGEHFSGDLLQKLKLYTRANIYNQYGPSETTVGVSYKLLNSASLITIGSPMDNCRLYILDNHLQPLPIGAYGELYIGGSCVANGYRSSPELTEQSFIESPFEPGERIYRSGDIGCWTPDGEVLLGGRKDSQIKLRGLRIELQEITSRIMQYPEISQAVVNLCNIDSQNLLTAYYTSEKDLPAADIISFISVYLPHYMIPNIFIRLPEIPLTHNGKTDYSKLPDPVINKNSEHPHTETQKKLMDIFCKVLERCDIGINSDYFLCGGDSLNAIETIAEIEQEFGVLIKITDLYALRTVELLDKRLGDDSEKESVSLNLSAAPTLDKYPLSSVQRSLYFQSRLDPTGIAYNMPGAFRVLGKLDIPRLEISFKKLIQTEEILRTRFEVEEDGIFQIIEDNVDFSLPILKAKSFKEASDIFVKPFDLGTAPLMRAAIWHDSEDNITIFIDTHHIISDGISTPIFLKRLDKLYQDGFCHTSPISYKDFSYFQENRDDSFLDTQKKYWEERVHCISDTLDLPIDYTRPKNFNYKGNKFILNLSEDMSKRCEEYCEKYDITPFMLFASVFSILLFKASGNMDIIVGTPVSGRRSKEQWNILGAFINTLPMRFKIEPGMSFAQYIDIVKKDVLDLLDNQDVSTDEIIAFSGVTRDLSRNPLYSVMFSYRPIDEKLFSINGQSLQYIPINTETSKLDLSLEAYQSANGFSFCFEYAASLFIENTISLYARSFEGIIHEILNKTQILLQDITATSPSDKFTLMDKVYNKCTPYIKIRIDTLADQMALVNPEAPAIIFHDKIITYKEFKELSDSIAAFLLESGVKRGDRIALCCMRGPDMLAALFAIMKTGCSYIPVLNSFPHNRLSYMLENSGAKFVLCDKPSSEKLIDELPCPLVLMDSSKRTFTPLNDLSTEDEIHVLFTSGSTGKPKGVSLKHKSISNLLLSIEEIMDKIEGNVLCTTNIIFDTFITETLLPLATGRCVVIADEEEMMLPWKIGELICKYNARIMQLTPSRLQMCLSNDSFAKAAGNLGLMILAGEALSNSLIRQLKSLGSLRIINMYGPTEAAVYVTAADLTDSEYSVIGKPLHNCRVYVLDEKLRPVMPSARGELYLSGECLASGYVNRDDLTQEAFIADPFFPGKKMYKSGDIGRLLPDGNIAYCGRADRQIKLNGQRIELDEITGAILNWEPISEATTIAVNHDDGSVSLKSFAVLKKNSFSTVPELKEALRKWLPEYMIPSDIEILPELPRTATGKTDVLSLSTLKAEVPEKHSRLESEITEIWRKFLKKDSVSPTDSFFDQGGSSLGALNILSQYFNKGWALTISQFYDNPSIKGQVEIIRSLDPEKYRDHLQESQENSIDIEDMSQIKPTSSNDGIFITGATGFLGAHLVKAAVDSGYKNIYCLVRSESNGNNTERFMNILTFYFGDDWVILNRDLIKTVTGDIEKKHLGINTMFSPDEIKYIIHSAADVNHYGNADDSMKTNCTGTSNVLALAKELNARFIHISTASVSGSYIVDVPQRKAIYTESDFDIGQNWQDNMYVKSKFLAEKFVKEEISQGLDAKIFRVGRIVGRSYDGMFIPDPKRNIFYHFITGLRVLDSIPEEFSDTCIEMTPVDECAEAIIKLMEGKLSVYHMFNPKTITLRELAAKLNKVMNEVSNEEFEESFINASSRLPPESTAALFEFWHGLKSHSLNIIPSAVETQKELFELGFDWSKPDVQIILSKFI